jgi:uncharacterized protein (UPF0548 family)
MQRNSNAVKSISRWYSLRRWGFRVADVPRQVVPPCHVLVAKIMMLWAECKMVVTSSAHVLRGHAAEAEAGCQEQLF